MNNNVLRQHAAGKCTRVETNRGVLAVLAQTSIGVCALSCTSFIGLGSLRWVALADGPGGPRDGIGVLCGDRYVTNGASAGQI